MGQFFPNFPKFEPKFLKILEKSGDFAQNLAQIWANWYMNRSLFLEKLVFVSHIKVPLSNFMMAPPYQNQT